LAYAHPIGLTREEIPSRSFSPEQGMESSERRIDDVVILKLKGRLTLGTQNLQARIADLLERGQKWILIDMSDVQYMDSTSVGDLVVSFTTATSQGGKLKLLNLPERIRELLDIHHLSSVFEDFDAEDEAVASFNAG
jgi:anti-sigma B factor antagonist